MKNVQKLSYILLGVFCTTLIGGVSIAALGEAGTESDPIVSKSYVEKRLGELEKKITDNNKVLMDQQLTTLQGQLAELVKATGGTGSAANTEFKLVQFKNGDVITLGDGTQFILRAGLAKAIAGPGGGLSDLTEGKDLKTDQDITTNHLLLVPKNDGRGVRILYDSWVMIKGTYQISPK